MHSLCFAFVRDSTREFEKCDATFGDQCSLAFGINAFDPHGNGSA
jgi:hypothetical protein